MTFFTDVADPIPFAGASAPEEGLAYQVYDPDRLVLGETHGGTTADRGVLLAQLQLAGLGHLRRGHV